MPSPSILIRPGTRDDVPKLLELIKELASFERAADQVLVTEEILLQDGFGAVPSFGLLVAETEGNVVGIALYYFAYSTWKGKYLYLEDFIVQEEHRGRGIGRLLFDEVVRIAQELGVKRMGWQVLDWNEGAIRFYENYGASLSDEWLNGRLTFE